MTEPKIKRVPAWLYKYGQTPRIIQTEAELEAAAAEGWVDHPVDFAPVPEATKAVPPEPPPVQAPKRKRKTAISRDARENIARSKRTAVFGPAPS